MTLSDRRTHLEHAEWRAVRLFHVCSGNHGRDKDRIALIDAIRYELDRVFSRQNLRFNFRDEFLHSTKETDDEADSAASNLDLICVFVIEVVIKLQQGFTDLTYRS